MIYSSQRIVLLSILCLGQLDLSWTLPKGCSFVSKSGQANIQIVCDRFRDLTFDFLLRKENATDYQKLDTVYTLHFHLIRSTILDMQLNNNNFIKTILSNETEIRTLVFNNIKGFEINMFDSVYDSTKFWDKSYKLELNFINTKLDFYSGDKLIRNCEEYLEEEKHLRYSLFEAMQMSSVHFIKTTYKTPICTLAFNRANIPEISWYSLIDTFMKTNLLKFVESNSNVFFESYIEKANLYVNNVGIDETLLHLNVFKEIFQIFIEGEIKYIQNNLFGGNNFQKLQLIYIFIHEFKRLSHKQGIEWIKNINENVSINPDDDVYTIFKNETHMISYNKNPRMFFIYLHQFAGKDIYSDRFKEAVVLKEVFPNEDFCLYEKYPFYQVVILLIDLDSINVQNDATCTFLWLIQYNEKLFKYTKFLNSYDPYIIYKYFNKDLGNISDLINDCQFKQRLSKCNKSQFSIIRTKQTNKMSFSEVMFLWDFISIILLPLICIFGIVTNILVIVNVSKKENKTILKENQYAYMRLKSIANCLIFFVQILSLMNICQGESGIYCPDIHRLVPIQYIKIIFVELFGNYLRFVSNLFYIAFLMNRLFLIGKDHSKFTKFMSETKVLHYSIFTLIVGFIISFVKVFRYRANFFEYNLDYPKNFAFDRHSSNHALIFIFLVFNSVSDLINGSVFLIFCLVIDISLALRIKATIKEKEEKAKSMNYLVEDKKKKENSDAINRAVLLVVLNSILNFTCKLPSTLISINDMVQSINSIIFYPRYFKVLAIAGMRSSALYNKIYANEMACFNSNFCQALEKFSIDLFLLSLALDLFFYYNFDRKFRDSFTNCFSKKESKK